MDEISMKKPEFGLMSSGGVNRSSNQQQQQRRMTATEA